jgi:hypothetical protein
MARHYRTGDARHRIVRHRPLPCLPVSGLPNVDFPTIHVNATLPAASPETMAASVATPLERQFSTIAGLDSISSTSTRGSSSITLQFVLDRPSTALRSMCRPPAPPSRDASPPACRTRPPSRGDPGWASPLPAGLRRRAGGQGCVQPLGPKPPAAPPAPDLRPGGGGCATPSGALLRQIARKLGLGLGTVARTVKSRSKTS